MIRIGLLVRSFLFLQLPHSLVMLHVRSLSLQLLCLHLLRVRRCLLSLLLQGGSPQDLPTSLTRFQVLLRVGGQ